MKSFSSNGLTSAVLMRCGERHCCQSWTLMSRHASAYSLGELVTASWCMYMFTQQEALCDWGMKAGLLLLHAYALLTCHGDPAACHDDHSQMARDVRHAAAAMCCRRPVNWPTSIERKQGVGFRSQQKQRISASRRSARVIPEW